MIKFIVSDMDGTLFEGHGETVFDLTERNQAALKKVQQSDIEFCVASGRMIGFGTHLMERYGFKRVRAAGFNGAVCYDQGEFVATRPLDRELIRQIVEMLKESFPQTKVIQIQGLNSERIFTSLDHPVVETYRQSIAKIGIGRIMDFTVDDFLEDDHGTMAGKLSVTMNNKEECLEVIQAVRAIVKDQCFVTMSNDTLIEIGNCHASKGVFVRYLREAYHLEKEEIAVIGDAMNDTEMYPEAGLCFAMENASEEVKAMADVIVKDVAQCIEFCIRRNEEEKADKHGKILC